MRCLERAAVQVAVDVAHATGNSGVISSTTNLPTDSQYTGQPVRPRRPSEAHGPRSVNVPS